jgi:hypothetical protein
MILRWAEMLSGTSVDTMGASRPVSAETVGNVHSWRVLRTAASPAESRTASGLTVDASSVRPKGYAPTVASPPAPEEDPVTGALEEALSQRRPPTTDGRRLFSIIMGASACAAERPRKPFSSWITRMAGDRCTGKSIHT